MRREGERYAGSRFPGQPAADSGGRASARPARRAGSARTSRRPARRQRPAAGSAGSAAASRGVRRPSLTKYAVESLCDALRPEVAPFGIRVALRPPPENPLQGRPAGPPRPVGAAHPRRPRVGRVHAPHGPLPGPAMTGQDQAAPQSARRGRYHHGDLREALIETAIEVLGERGAGAFSMAEASRRLGVAVSAPYRHFADRDALLAAVALRAASLLTEQFDRMAASGDPATRLAGTGCPCRGGTCRQASRSIRPAVSPGGAEQVPPWPISGSGHACPGQPRWPARGLSRMCRRWGRWRRMRPPGR